jgi:hypothetical protein
VSITLGDARKTESQSESISSSSSTVFGRETGLLMHASHNFCLNKLSGSTRIETDTVAGRSDQHNSIIISLNNDRVISDHIQVTG